MRKSDSPVIANPWQALRQFTAARIALGRSGVSLPTAAQLDFQMAHAKARDAIHQTLDVEALRNALHDGLQADISGAADSIALCSAAETRDIYLQRPDFGRRLNTASRTALQSLQAQRPDQTVRPDLAIVIADGLSALAIEQNALPFLNAVMPSLRAAHWTLAPLAIVSQGRVAIGDEIGERLNAKAVVVMIGERPGLSSPDSMGLYLTWSPRVGLTDESRNCISNVRPAGLPYQEAASRLQYLLTQAHSRQLSGVLLKDETVTADAQHSLPGRNFLLD